MIPLLSSCRKISCVTLVDGGWQAGSLQACLYFRHKNNQKTALHASARRFFSSSWNTEASARFAGDLVQNCKNFGSMQKFVG
jgi:hypothetical protein